MPDEKTYRCPPAWFRWTALAGGAAIAWLFYLAVTAERPFDIGLATFLAVAATGVTGAVLCRLWTHSTSVSPRGLRIDRGRRTVLVPWERVGALRVEEVSVELARRPGSPVLNDRAFCYEVDGMWHELPYLTSQSGRVVSAEVAELRRLWRRERGRHWVTPPVPARAPAEPERRGRALPAMAAFEFALVCVGVLLLDLGGRSKTALSPADGAGLIVFLTVVLVALTALVGLLQRHRTRVSTTIVRPVGKRQKPH